MASVTAPQASTRPVPVPPIKRNYGHIVEMTWIWSVVGYTVLRFAIAWGAFSDHGANVWIFGLLDVGTAWPYAKAIALVCKRSANSAWGGLPIPIMVALASFFAPYAYLWFAAGEMPGGVRLGLALCVGVLLLAATSGVLLKTRRLRREAELDKSAVIDLRSSEILGDVTIDLTTDTPTILRQAPARQA